MTLELKSLIDLCIETLINNKKYLLLDKLPTELLDHIEKRKSNKKYRAKPLYSKTYHSLLIAKNKINSSLLEFIDAVELIRSIDKKLLSNRLIIIGETTFDKYINMNDDNEKIICMLAIVDYFASEIEYYKRIPCGQSWLHLIKDIIPSMIDIFTDRDSYNPNIVSTLRRYQSQFNN